jgi:hypothetical protein
MAELAASAQAPGLSVPRSPRQPDSSAQATSPTGFGQNGKPLESRVRADLEKKFRHDFSHVRIHTDTHADDAARDSGAQALATGRHVAFAADRFDPGTHRGRGLLAHELVHVMQSDSAASHPDRPASTVPALEREATEVSEAVAAGRTPPPVRGAARGMAQPLRQPEEPPTFGNIPGDTSVGAGLRRVRLSLSGGKWVEYAAGRSPATRTARGSYDFVIIGNSIWAVKSGDGRLGHTEAAAGQRVVWAGIAQFNKHGVMQRWTNESGHMLPAGQFVGNATSANADLKKEEGKYVHAKAGPVTRPDGTRQGPQLPVIQSRNEPTAGQGGATAAKPGAPPSTGSTATAPAAPGNATSGAPAVTPAPKAPTSASGPAAATTSATTTTSASPGNTAGSGSTGSGTAKTTARVGMPDMKPMQVGGPSARGQALGGGVVVGAQLKDWIMGKLGERTQGKRLDAALAKKLEFVAQRQQDHPELGVLVKVYWHVSRGNEGETSQRFDDISLQFGTTEKEARESRINTLLNLSGDASSTEIDERWIEPAEPLPLAELPTPHRKIAIARLGPGRLRIQGVSWGGMSGFDQHGRRSASTTVPDGEHPSVAILMPPASITFRNGKLRHSVDIGIEKRLTADDHLVPVVDDLDAAMVFPLDPTAATLLAKGREIKDNLRQLGGDYELTRWVNPADLRITQILDDGQVARRPPSAEEKFEARIRMLPVNTGDLLKQMGRGAGNKLKVTPKALERFADIVPFDLTPEELALLVKQMGPVGTRNIDQVLDHLEQAISRLPGRSGSSGPEGGNAASTDDTRTIRQKLSATDWSVVPERGGVFFRDKGPIGIAEGTRTSSFAYGIDAAGNRFGGIVEISIGKPGKESTPVTVLSSSRLLTPDGRLYTPAKPLTGRTFNVRPLDTFANRGKSHAAGAGEKP